MIKTFHQTKGKPGTSVATTLVSPTLFASTKRQQACKLPGHSNACIDTYRTRCEPRTKPKAFLVRYCEFTNQSGRFSVLSITWRVFFDVPPSKENLSLLLIENILQFNNKEKLYLVT